MHFLFLGQGGYEHLVQREAEELGGLSICGAGDGFVHAEGEVSPVHGLDQFCFPHLTLIDPREVSEGSVNAMAARLADDFFSDFRGLQVSDPWFCDVWVRRDLDGLGRRATSVKNAFTEKVKAKMARVARLGTRSFPPQPGDHRGWAMFFEDFSRIRVSSRLHFGGQQRMADDPAASSRSYLKVEEAYRLAGYGPAEGEKVIDLGAAPGGWSYSAAKRGAQVDAIDNGPMKGGAAGHPRITHLREDGFRYGLNDPDVSCDWLFCDMVEDPFRVLRLLEEWVETGRCQRFIFNLKFGRTDPIALLREVKAFRERRLAQWPVFRARHLFHDREEITLVGARAAPRHCEQPSVESTR